MDIKEVVVSETSPIDQVGPFSWKDFLNRVSSFHGYAAPGVVVGGIMVSIAMKQIPKGVLFDAICETSSCLPDAVQLLTPCTIGNGWLKIIKLGRYAVSLYDKYKGNGVRIYLNPDKLQKWDEIQAWLFKLKTKREQDADQLQEQIRKAGYDIYAIHPIQIKSPYLTKHSKGSIGICSVCGEAYPIKDGVICLGCEGEAPYEAAVSTGSEKHLTYLLD